MIGEHVRTAICLVEPMVREVEAALEANAEILEAERVTSHEARKADRCLWQRRTDGARFWEYRRMKPACENGQHYCRRAREPKRGSPAILARWKLKSANPQFCPIKNGTPVKRVPFEVGWQENQIFPRLSMTLPDAHEFVIGSIKHSHD